MDFSEYFEVIDHYLYSHNRVSELLKDKNINNMDEILKFAFESQKGNSLLIVTFFAQKIVEEEGFIEKLEKNYGIYFEVENFIKDLNEKLEEIKSISELYRYIESDFGKNKTDLELVIEAYNRAKEKGYIRNIESRNRNQRGKNRGRSGSRKRKERSRSYSKERRDRSRNSSRYH